MSTIDKIKIDGELIIKKLKNGEALSKSDCDILKIYNSLFSKNAGNAGKRKIIKTGK